MKNNIFKILLLAISIIFSLYLLLPDPPEPKPLPHSFRSPEPGDNGQIPGLFAYYTNLPRNEIIAFYQNQYSYSSFYHFPLITFKLIHPPEYAWEVITDTIPNTFLEEVIQPFRGSLYLAGDIPAEDPFIKNNRTRSNFSWEGKEYKTKILIYRKSSNPLVRLIIFWGSIFVLKWLIIKAKRIYEENFRNHS
jgi:hypothetical protein